MAVIDAIKYYFQSLTVVIHFNVNPFNKLNDLQRECKNVRTFLRRLRIETYLKDARANRKETHL